MFHKIVDTERAAHLPSASNEPTRRFRHESDDVVFDGNSRCRMQLSFWQRDGHGRRSVRHDQGLLLRQRRILKIATMVLTCARSGRTCRLASDLALGEPCKDNVQCASRNCGYNYRSCTKSCTSNTACDSSTVCARDPYSPSMYCLPSCKTDDDCAVYRDGNGPEVHCKTTKTPIGDSVSACSP